MVSSFPYNTQSLDFPRIQAVKKGFGARKMFAVFSLKLEHNWCQDYLQPWLQNIGKVSVWQVIDKNNIKGP